MLDILVYLLLGSVAGFFAGLLGIGGGIFIVPVLFYYFEQDPLLHQDAILIAVSTSLTTIAFTCFGSIWAHVREGNIPWFIVLRWVPFVVLGGLTSVAVVQYLNVDFLLIMLGFLLGIVGITLLMNMLPTVTSSNTFGSKYTHFGFPFFIGMVANLAGVAGGNFIVPVLLYFGLALRQAIAVASTLGVPISLTGAIGYIVAGWWKYEYHPDFIGYVHLPSLLCILSSSVLFAWLGAKVTLQMTATKLIKRLLGVLLCYVGTTFIYKSSLIHSIFL